MIFPTNEQLQIFKGTTGAISVHEALAIMNIAAQSPKGTCAEMGSNRGKSGIAASVGLVHTENTELHMVDPLYLDSAGLNDWRNSEQWANEGAWQEAHNDDFKARIEGRIRDASEGRIQAVLHGDYSTSAIPRLHAEHGDFAYVFIDSDQHQYELVSKELELLRNRMVIGGILCFHDFTSQFTGVERAYREMLQGGQYAELPIDWDSIKTYVASIGGEDGNNSWHACDNRTPCFVGALKRVK